MRWSEEETIQLIELYKSHRYLWDNTSDLYKNGVARKQAYDSIVKQMEIPRLTPQDVRSKIKNLRSSYYHELRRMDKLGTDKLAARKVLWFQAFKPIMSVLHLGKESITESDASSEEEQLDSCFIVEESSNMDAYVVSIKQEYLDEMVHQDDKDIAPVDDYLEPAPKRVKTLERKTVEKPFAELDLAGNSGISGNSRKGKELDEFQLFSNNKTVEKPLPELDLPGISGNSTKGKKLDEFQLFSNNIAAQLRRLPLDRALILQVEVQSLVAKERIRIYKRQSADPKDDDDSS